MVAGDLCFATSPTTIAVGGNPGRIAIGDLDRSGDLDAVVVIGATDRVNIMIGNGSGGFTSNGTLQGAGAGATDVALGLLDADLTLDVVVASRTTDMIRRYLGDGTGSFTNGQSFTTVTGGNAVWAAPEAIALGDFDNDGAGDVLVAVWETVNILYGDGTGGFGAPTSLAMDNALEGANAVELFNVDGGTSLDAVVGYYDTNNVGVFLNDGSGTLVYDSLTTTGGGGDGMYDLAHGDLNGDTFPDVPAPIDADGLLHILDGDGGGGLTADGAPLAINGARFVAVGDVDADCDIDLVTHRVTNNNQNQIVIYPAQGGGAFTAPTPIDVDEAPRDIEVGDFNNDGMADAIVSLGSAGEIGVILSDP